jgi:hypothetical protein
MQFAFGLVGLGPTGCIFLGCLPPARLADVIVFESGCIGGDLARHWGSVLANIPRRIIEPALRSVPAWRDAPMDIIARYGDEECPLLSDAAQQIRALVTPLLAQVTVRNAHVASARQTLTGWSLQVQGGGEGSEVHVGKLILATGATPRTMDIPKPHIPLEIALSEVRLREYLGNDTRSLNESELSHCESEACRKRFVVFGTSHSGTLILKNLRSVGCTGTHVTAVYKGARPFYLLRDGHTEGLKAESATIVDAITCRAWGDQTPRLVPAADMEGLLRAVLEADYVVYAIGFQTRAPALFDMRGAPVCPVHDPKTGALAPGVWGFGVGFPSLYKTNLGTMAADVGFAAFAGHIKANMGAILT